MQYPETLQGISEYWRKRYEEIMSNPPPMANCSLCGKSRTKREIDNFRGICFCCNQKREERQEMLEWLYEENRCGLVKEDRKFDFSRIKPGLQHAGVLSSLSNWSVAVSGGRGFYLAGDVGTGKTTLAKCIINQHIQKTLKRAIFLNYPSLFFELKHGGFNNPVRELMRQAQDASLLVIDDFGVGAKAAWSENEILPIIDARLARGLPTIFTSNSLLEFQGIGKGLGVLGADRVTPRVLDRVKQAVNGHQIVLLGESLRGRADA